MERDATTPTDFTFAIVGTPSYNRTFGGGAMRQGGRKSIMTRRRERWVTVVTSVMALAGLLCLVGCPPPQVRELSIDYQEIGIIQLDSRFVPSRITLIRGRPARLHLTDASAKTQVTFSIDALDIHAQLRTTELTQITLSKGQVRELDGKRFTCKESGNSGTFRVVKAGKAVRPAAVGGVVELSVVMSDDLAAPHLIILRKGVPAKLYVTKTRGEEEDDTFLIEAWDIEEDVEVGKVTVIELTPTKTEHVTFMGITTPSSRGTIQVVD